MKIKYLENVSDAKEMVLYGTVTGIEEIGKGDVRITYTPRDCHGIVYEDVSVIVHENESVNSHLYDLLEATAWFQDIEENGEATFTYEQLKENMLGMEVYLKVTVLDGVPEVEDVSACLQNLDGWGFLLDSPMGPVKFIEKSDIPQSFKIFAPNYCEKNLEN